MKTQSGAKVKASAVELAILMGLCLLAGIGAGLAFDSAPIGLGLAGIGLIAVAAYALAAKVVSLPNVSLPKVSGRRERRERREETRGLSVTDISTRRRGAAGQASAWPEETRLEPTPEPKAAPEEGPISAVVTTAVEPDRVVPFRMPPVRL